MSVKFGGIDLNCDAVDSSSDVTDIESTVGIGGLMPNDDALMKQDQTRVSVGGPNSNDDKFRVSMEEEEGMVKNGNIGGVEMESRKLDVNDSVGGMGIDLGLKADGFDSGDSHLQGRLIGDDDEEGVKGGEVSLHDKEEDFNAMRLVVDLNVVDGADGEMKSNDKIGYERTEVKEFWIDQVSPFPDGLVEENVANRVNGFENGNPNATTLIDDQGTGITQLEEDKSKETKDVGPMKQEYRTEKEGEYYVSDLVWGKVKSHPWWPGQIYDPSAASTKALKYKKKDCFLIAYFGDQTFAWNDVSHIKPFGIHFSQMEKQSNMDSFTHAVDCALEEVSRRVEYGLACKCLSDEVLAKLKTQVIYNAGIKKEASVRVGGDKISTAVSFESAKFVHCLKGLAEDPMGLTNKLDFITTRAQLLSFSRWKGFPELPTIQMSGGLLETNDDVNVFSKEGENNESVDDAVLTSKGQILIGKGNSLAQDKSSQKRKNVSGNGVDLGKKKKCLSKLRSEGCSNGENILEEKAERKSTDSSGKSSSSHLSPLIANEMPSLPEKLFKVGDRICKVANQLSAQNTKTGSNASQKHGDEMVVSLSGGASHGVSSFSCEKSRGVDTPAKNPSADEMLSHLSLAARNPMEDYNIFSSSFNLFIDLRNSVCLDKSMSRESNQLTSETAETNTRKNPSVVNAFQSCEFEGVEDSYWTDRIIQGTVEQVPFEPESKNGMAIGEGEAALNASPKSDLIHNSSAMKVEAREEKTVGCANDESKGDTPTLLILNFSDLESVPSEANLNVIFSRFGPLYESNTEVLKKSKRAKVFFKRRSDAERAFSSAGKYSTFGPSLVSYKLKYAATLHKPSTSGTKRKRKDVKPVGGSVL